MKGIQSEQPIYQKNEKTWYWMLPFGKEYLHYIQLLEPFFIPYIIL